MSIKRQTLWNLAPQLVTAAVSLFSMPLLVRFLGKDLYALFFIVTTVSGMFGFSDLGLGVVVGRNLSVSLGKKDPAAVRRYWGTGNMIVLPFLCLATLGFVAVTVWLGPKWYDKISPANVTLFRECLVANGIGLFFSYYGTFWLTVSQAYLDFKFIGLIRSVITPLQIIPAVILAWRTHNPLWPIAWSAFLGAIQLGVLIWHARRHYALGTCLRFARLSCAREMAGSTVKMLLNLVVGAIFAPMDRNILARLAGSDQLVPYGLAYNLSSRLQGLSVSVMGPVLHNAARVAEEGYAAASRIYNEVFGLMFEWYLFATLWLALWHPVLLRLYFVHSMGYSLGQETAVTVGPLLAPLMAACCFTAIANISASQLFSMNRMGTIAGFAIAAGLLTIPAVWIGYEMAGVLGGAFGYLFSRIVYVVQDIYTIRLIGAAGWLAAGTWVKVVGQTLVAALFSLVYLTLPSSSYWLLIPAALHGGLVAAWLLRQPLRRALGRG